MSPSIGRHPGELYDVTVVVMSPDVGSTLAKVQLKIIVVKKNLSAPKFDRDGYSAEVCA